MWQWIAIFEIIKQKNRLSIEIKVENFKFYYVVHASKQVQFRLST